MRGILTTLLNIVWEFIEAVAFALIVFFVCYLLLFQPNQVKGHSMEPTFHDGEYIFTDKISYKISTPARGDIIVFRSPKNANVDYIKRIIALPGEKIKISRGKVYINNRLLDESSYLSSTVYTGPQNFLPENKEIIIPPGKYFVMGDNRPGSSDSRDFGPISPSEFVGKVFFRYWPLDRIGAISGANPILQDLSP